MREGDDFLRREAYRSVAEHEVGHTVGLMHNFIASADAMNYQDGYWDLRKDTIGVEVGGRRVLPLTPQNLLDAAKPNQKQIEGGMYEYQYSSIMDYGARVNSQNRGTGKYDDAAILFAYSGGFEPGWVEVFNETRHDYTRTNVTMDVDVMGQGVHGARRAGRDAARPRSSTTRPCRPSTPTSTTTRRCLSISPTKVWTSLKRLTKASSA